jgi:hypothetical protein
MLPTLQPCTAVAVALHMSWCMLEHPQPASSSHLVYPDYLQDVTEVLGGSEWRGKPGAAPPPAPLRSLLLVPLLLLVLQLQLLKPP